MFSSTQHCAYVDLKACWIREALTSLVKFHSCCILQELGSRTADGYLTPTSGPSALDITLYVLSTGNETICHHYD